MVEALGQHETTLPLVRRVVGHVQFYGEQERGGRTVKYVKNQGIGNFWFQDCCGGAVFYMDPPLPPQPTSQVLPAAKFEEQLLRRWGTQTGEVEGGQPSIGWIPSGDV